jgi:esterase/lipase
MKKYIGSVLMLIGVFIIGGGITSALITARENQIKSIAENPELVMSKDDIIISRMTSIVDNFTELNKNLEELIEAQKKQNEAMKQELNSRIQNYPRTTLEIRPEMYEQQMFHTATFTHDFMNCPMPSLPDGMFKGHFYLSSDSVVYKEGN